jgi:copper chaperone
MGGNCYLGGRFWRTTPKESPLATINFTIPDMACSACAETITQAIQALDAAAIVEANPTSKALAVNTSTSSERIAEAIAEAGYKAQAVSASA